MKRLNATGSIQKKIAGMMMLTSAISLLIACFLFAVYEVFNIHHELPRRIGILASILSLESISGLDFRDHAALEDSLTALVGDAAIISAAIYDMTGKRFTSYVKPGLENANKLPAQIRLFGDRHYFADDYLFVTRDIRLDNRHLGAVMIQSGIGEVGVRIRKSVVIVLSVFALSMVLSMAISARFQNVITVPILELSKKAEEVSVRKDYSIRAEKLTGDEIGKLVENFNEMLSKIQERDTSLRELNEELENHVAARTNDLFREVEERKRIENEVRTLNAELEQRVKQRTQQLETANEELESFAYTVSHDLRAPLRHVAGFAELLEDCISGDNPEAREYLNDIRESINKMDRLINDLLSFSQMGRSGMTLENLDMNKVVKEALNEFDHELGGRTIKWDFQRLPVVSGDPAMLRIVVSNLISNALKYTRQREVSRITIGCDTDESKAEYRFFVMDNGVGFNMKYVDKLFGVFQRLHGNDEFEGTGIGLATVRRIISRHHGRTWAVSTPGKGATVYFTLPIASGGIS